jgi:hypothetical protein
MRLFAHYKHKRNGRLVNEHTVEVEDMATTVMFPTEWHVNNGDEITISYSAVEPPDAGRILDALEWLGNRSEEVAHNGGAIDPYKDIANAIRWAIGMPSVKVDWE